MCGIAGFYQLNDNVDTRIQLLKKMLTRIKHRGPDQSGIYLSDKIGLGSVRLSIIDIANGTMPLSNSNKTHWIVFNGEIFNYIELRQELLNKGYSFITQSDTEVIVNLYAAYGPDFVKKLNGQFAIAIWDKSKQELFLARDRVGIRPLYYTQMDGTFVFASEIKALMEFPHLTMKLSPKVLSEYFTFWTSLSPNTPFVNIFEVPPGHYMLINDTIKSTTYWELPLHKPGTYNFTNLNDAKQEFETLFSDAVKLRLRADVPVAAYLSGGLDSSATTAFIKENAAIDLKTFSIGFTEKEFDESAYQNLASHFFNTQHTSITCSPKDISAHFKDVVWHTEAPLLRTSPAPMGLLANSVHNNSIKVVITGEGADELLGGYNIFKENKIRHFWAKDPKSKYRPMLLKRLYPYLPQMEHANSTALQLFFGYKLQDTDSPIYSHILRWHNTSRINNYLSLEFKSGIKDYQPIKKLEAQLTEKLHGYDALTKAQWIEFNIFLSGYLLSSQGDRMAMAHSVEGRYPFLDHRIVEFCMGLHPNLKLNGLNEKFLLKKTMEGKLPEPILSRPKQAYRSPIKSAFISEDLPGYLTAMLSEECITGFGIFNTSHVGNLLHKMRSSTLVSEIDNMALTAILSTQILYDLFIKRSIPELTDNALIECDKTIMDFNT